MPSLQTMIEKLRGRYNGHLTESDPHTGYRLESADHSHQTTGAQAGQLDHGAAMVAASLLDDDHTVYILKTLLNAQSIIIAVSDNTPVVLELAEQTLVGRATGGNVAALTQAQAEALLVTSRHRSLMFPIHISRIVASGKPTLVTLGAYRGFSLPTYAADEEVFSCVCMPWDWDGVTNPVVYVGGWLDTANADKKFQLQVSWEHSSPGDVMPATSHDVDIETDTGTAEQYAFFKVAHAIDLDIDTPDDLIAGDALAIRIRRLAASEAEIAGEFVVEGAVLYYKVGSFGASS